MGRVGCMMKDGNLVMNSARIHKHKDIAKYIENREYKLYLPPYSPECNPIEQFWSACKSKSKRKELLKQDILIIRMKSGCSLILFQDLHGFCHCSAVRLEAA